MFTVKLVVSDLHVADGSSLLDCFGESQQSAFEGLLRATSSSIDPFDQAESVELIINGDCFDFLVTEPYTTHLYADQTVAVEKIEKILAAHGHFFTTLRSFVEKPGRTITFITGNHDLELCFAEVRSRICTAIVGKSADPRVCFCPTRFYRPCPDVYIEHGNYYDFWNHATEGLWDEEGQPLTSDPQAILLPVGSRYFQHSAYLISQRYAYFDHFQPSINSTRQIAMLCLLNPTLLVETAHRTMQMLSYPRQALTNLVSGEEHNPVRLFEEIMQDFLAFQQDMMTQKSDWKPAPGEEQISPEDMREFIMLREALALPRDEAMAAICVPVAYQMGESVAQGMSTMLQRDPTLRYALAGHTHMMRTDPVNQGKQVYLNTASWTTRLALPSPDEITSELVDWLSTPGSNTVPLRDVTEYVFALITTMDETSHVSLCAWEGGVDGYYRIFA